MKVDFGKFAENEDVFKDMTFKQVLDSQKFFEKYVSVEFRNTKGQTETYGNHYYDSNGSLPSAIIDEWMASLAETGKISWSKRICEIVIDGFKGKRLPFNFGKVQKFEVVNCKNLENCEGFPEEADYIYVFDCHNITSLKGITQRPAFKKRSVYNIGGNINLKSLEGMPEVVETINGTENAIETLKGCPKIIGHTLNLSNNKLKTIEDAPFSEVRVLDVSENSELTISGNEKLLVNEKMYAYKCDKLSIKNFENEKDFLVREISTTSFTLHFVNTPKETLRERKTADAEETKKKCGKIIKKLFREED